MTKFLWSVLGVGALVVGAQAVYAVPETDSKSQVFKVSVPKRVTITAPLAVVPIKTLTVLDYAASELTLTEDLVTFADQQWAVKGNVVNGVKVDFEAAPFSNLSVPIGDPAIYQNSRLSVNRIAGAPATVGPATWSVVGGLVGATSATSTSNFTAVSPVSPNAHVQYSSNRVGQTEFAVTVELVTADLYLVVAGDYETTVVGTVTEN